MDNKIKTPPQEPLLSSSRDLIVDELTHELKNTLVVINISSQLCLEVKDLPPVVQKNIGHILQNSQKASRIINDIQDLCTAGAESRQRMRKQEV
ncbi:MAG: hypothetical protein HY879_18670 [Deltaproteobacteria bacterium]|nr:hypothetical protein [Deltaproteobacteria bacterium]